MILKELIIDLQNTTDIDFKDALTTLINTKK